MLIALASQNRQSLTAHAGKCRHFFIVDTTQGYSPRSLELETGQMLSVWSGEGEHPLLGVEAVIAASMGEGVAKKLAARGVKGIATSERGLERAVALLAEGRLPQLALRPPSGKGICCG